MLKILLSQNTLLFVFAILLAVIIAGYLCYTKIDHKKPAPKKKTTAKTNTKKKSTKKK